MTRGSDPHPRLSRETQRPQEGDGVAHVEPGFAYFLKQRQKFDGKRSKQNQTVAANLPHLVFLQSHRRLYFGTVYRQ